MCVRTMEGSTQQYRERVGSTSKSGMVLVKKKGWNVLGFAVIYGAHTCFSVVHCAEEGVWKVWTKARSSFSVGTSETRVHVTTQHDFA